MSEQDDNLDRVSDRIGDAIQAFYALAFEQNDLTFTLEDLRLYVRLAVGMVAPGSPDRVMRALRRAGVLNYSVLNRAGSLYQVEKLPPKPWRFNGDLQGELF